MSLLTCSSRMLYSLINVSLPCQILDHSQLSYKVLLFKNRNMAYPFNIKIWTKKDVTPLLRSKKILHKIFFDRSEFHTQQFQMWLIIFLLFWYFHTIRKFNRYWQLFFMLILYSIPFSFDPKLQCFCCEANLCVIIVFKVHKQTC